MFADQIPGHPPERGLHVSFLDGSVDLLDDGHTLHSNETPAERARDDSLDHLLLVRNLRAEKTVRIDQCEDPVLLHSLLDGPHLPHRNFAAHSVKLYQVGTIGFSQIDQFRDVQHPGEVLVDKLEG